MEKTGDAAAAPAPDGSSAKHKKEDENQVPLRVLFRDMTGSDWPMLFAAVVGALGVGGFPVCAE